MIKHHSIMAQFLGMYSQDMDTPSTIDITRRQLLCDVLAGSLLTLLAREEPLKEKQVRQLCFDLLHESLSK